MTRKPEALNFEVVLPKCAEFFFIDLENKNLLQILG